MQYCRFQTEAGPQYGEVVTRGGNQWIERLLPPFEEDLAAPAAAAMFEPIPFGRAVLLAPVAPSKIVCIGRNYSDHAAELGNDLPKEPLIFLKPPSAILAPGEPILLPELSRRVDYEGELGIVIGRRCRHVGPDEPVEPYIRGFTIVNDVTARDLQRSDEQWSRAKGFDTFCPVGPLVTGEVHPRTGLGVQTRLNKALKQDGNTRDLIFDIGVLLRHISAVMTLLPGDLVATGTPAGVGPMQPGDLVEVSIEGIGTLSNPVRRDEPRS